MIKYKFFIFIFFIVCSGTIKSQGPTDFIASDYHAFYFNPQNIGISVPQVTDFVRHGNLGVDHYNGLLNLNIDLGGYKDADFHLPMSIKYISSGFIPSKRPSIVGYNWFLNFGGVVTRTVKGSPDDTKGNYENDKKKYIKDGLLVAVRDSDFVAYTEQELTDFDVNIVSKNNVPYSWGDFEYDMEPDIFTFSFGTHSGSFIIGNQGFPVSLSGDGYRIDISDLAVQEYSVLSAPVSSQIKISTPDGYTYILGGNTSYLEYFIPNNPNQLATTSRYITSWYLHTILAPNGRKVEFYYNSRELDNCYNYFLYSHYQTGIWHNLCGTSPSVHVNKISDQIEVRDKVHSPVISRVKIDDAEISFQTTTGIAFFKQNDYSYFISRILYTYDSTQIRDISFNYLSSGKYTFLSKVEQGDQTYEFEYNMTTFPSPLTLSLDHWGFWNGGDSTVVNNVEDYCLNINSHRNTIQGNHYKAGLLKKIKYPTGGESEIVYEPNRYNWFVSKNPYMASLSLQPAQTNNTLCGGARVSQVLDYDPVNDQTSSLRTFQYVNPDTGQGSGIIRLKPKYHAHEFISLAGVHLSGLSQCATLMRHSYEDISANTLGFNENLPEYHIGYSDVIETFANNSRTHYRYTSYADIPNCTEGVNYSIVHIPLPHGNATLTNLSTYQVAEKSNLYKTNDLSHFRGKLKSATMYNSFDSVVQVDSFTYNLNQAKDMYQLSLATAPRGKTAYRIYSTPCLLIQKETIDATGYRNTEYYEYNNKSVIAEQKTITSEGNYLAMRYKYATDYSYTNLNDGGKSLFDKNMITKPLEIKKVLIENGTSERTLETLRLNYKLNNSRPVLDYVEKKKNTNWVNIMEYRRYDQYNNPTHTVENGSLHTVYLRSYKGQHIVSKIVNAAYEDVVAKSQTVNLNIENLLRSVSLRNEDVEKLNLLRGTLSQAQMMIYTYFPMIGIKSITDPRGLTNFYSYDSAGRLKENYYEDANGVKKMIELYKYNYAD